MQNTSIYTSFIHMNPTEIAFKLVQCEDPVGSLISTNRELLAVNLVCFNTLFKRR